ncbi:hypothetical protein PsYK624_033340 [Phanerochaete sordida]|uniref:Uncharacterized protein n=1 Tax=Phanerochaete sordida TaxID=48140 RepID=A0A9P3L9G8_9APHY|nr:hypothetical protein PsYK624_033340 [Phanerochaete sordida]
MRCITEIEDLSDLLGIYTVVSFSLSADLVPVLLESAMFGVYTLLVVVAMVVILRSRSALPAKKAALLATCGLMYAAAATHLGMSLWSLFRINSLSGIIQAAAADCLSSLNKGIACQTIDLPDITFGPDGNTLKVDKTVDMLLGMNMILSDMVVLWRAWMLWPRRRIIQGFSCLLIAGTLVMLLWTCAWNIVDGNFPNAVAICLSWSTNVWSTSLIAVRAWQHRRAMAPLGASGSRTRAELALLLLIESGVLYCLFWLLPLASSIINFIAPLDMDFVPPKGTIGHFYEGIIDLWQGCLIDLVGIYPTAVILLAQLSNHRAQKLLSINEMPTLQLEHSTAGPGLREGCHGDSAVRGCEWGHVVDADRSDAIVHLSAFVEHSRARSMTVVEQSEKAQL